MKIHTAIGKILLKVSNYWKLLNSLLMHLEKSYILWQSSYPIYPS